jgi:hypothetical protein
MEKLILKATTRINSEDKTVYIEYRIENEWIKDISYFWVTVDLWEKTIYELIEQNRADAESWIFNVVNELLPWMYTIW